MTQRRKSGLFVGHLVDDNGLGTLLEALDLFPGARIVAIGSGPEEPRVRAHPSIDLLGRSARYNAQKYMERAAYLVLTEDEPRKVIEAFAHGLPVIASRVGTLADFVEPGSARDLARRLAWAEAFPEKMRQMGECAKADYQARFVADWSYQRLFGDRRRSARL